MERQEIAIWGTGTRAKKFYNLVKDKYNIKYFFDNNKEKHDQMLYGVPIKKWSKEYNLKIVIASSFWKEIAEQLTQKGLVPFCDFGIDKHIAGKVSFSEIKLLCDLSTIEVDLSNSFVYKAKKIAIVYGNCQTGLIEKMIRMNKNFSKDYVVIETPKVCEFLSGNKDILESFVNDDYNLMRNVDLFIFQHVSRQNQFSEILNTDTLISKLKRNCKKVEILNLYFTGYFPQMKKNSKNIYTDIIESGLFLSADKYIDKMLDENMDADDILNRVLDEMFLSESEINMNIKNSFDELLRREKRCDVKIVDYIFAHFRKYQLFYSHNHPSERLLIEYTNRILEFCGYEPDDINEIDIVMQCGSLKGQDIPIYPCVIKCLELENYEKTYYPNRYLYDSILLNIKDYLYLYIKSCNEFNKNNNQSLLTN